MKKFIVTTRSGTTFAGDSSKPKINLVEADDFSGRDHTVTFYKNGSSIAYCTGVVSVEEAHQGAQQDLLSKEGKLPETGVGQTADSGPEVNQGMNTGKQQAAKPSGPIQGPTLLIPAGAFEDLATLLARGALAGDVVAFFNRNAIIIVPNRE